MRNSFGAFGFEKCETTQGVVAVNRCYVSPKRSRYTILVSEVKNQNDKFYHNF